MDNAKRIVVPPGLPSFTKLDLMWKGWCAASLSTDDAAGLPSLGGLGTHSTSTRLCASSCGCWHMLTVNLTVDVYVDVGARVHVVV